MAITEKKLNNWAKQHDLKKLHLALLTHDYKIRISAIKHLGQIRNRESITHLEKLIDDAFVSVLKEALEAIRGINPSHPALVDFEKKIAGKEAFEARRKMQTEVNFQPIREEEEREKLIRMAKEHSIRKIERQVLAEERRQMVDWKVATFIAATAGSIAWLLYYFSLI